MNLSICILTYRRNEGLRRLFQGLRQLSFQRNPMPNIRIIVVDNDPAGEGARYVEEEIGDFPWPITCKVEREKGISYARNTALLMAVENSEFAVFIDDDEVPEPQWLDELMDAQQKFQADVVAGPVLPQFPEDAPQWSKRGGFYDRQRFQTGQELPFAASGNVLIRSSMLKTFSSWFDKRFALTGGEDTHFFMRISQAGYRIVWSNEAVVFEPVPHNRLQIGWLMRRSYRTGITYVQCELEIKGNWKTTLLRIGKAFLRIIQGTVYMPVAILGGRIPFTRSLLLLCRGLGMLAGMSGLRFYEYQNQKGALKQLQSNRK